MTNKQAKLNNKQEYHRMWKSIQRCRNSYKRKISRSSAPSSTTGKSKGPNCTASSLDRFMAYSGRSHKHPGYEAWCRTHKKG